MRTTSALIAHIDTCADSEHDNTGKGWPGGNLVAPLDPRTSPKTFTMLVKEVVNDFTKESANDIPTLSPGLDATFD